MNTPAPERAADPTPEAQALADKIFKWPGHAFTDGRVAEEVDAFAREAVEKERERFKTVLIDLCFGNEGEFTLDNAIRSISGKPLL